MATGGKTATVKKSPRGTGTRYEPEFRREALRMLDAGRSMTAVASELGVSMATLSQWRLKEQAGMARGRDGAAIESVTAENDRLKRELKFAKMELEIAKKAAALFARQSG